MGWPTAKKIVSKENNIIFSDEDLKKQIDDVYEPSDEAINYEEYENYLKSKETIDNNEINGINDNKVNDFDPQEISTIIIPKKSSYVSK